MPEGVADPETFRKSYDELAAFKAAEEVKRATIPAPEAYKVELPKDFKAPPGVEFKFNEADPLIGQLRQFANKSGLNQEQFEQGLSLYAASQVATQQQIATARDAEISKLGANATARVTNVMTWLKAVAGDDLGTALANNLWTAKQVEAFERMIGRFTSQGGSTFTASGREPGGQGMADADWDKLSYAEKLDYARKHAQPQLNGSGR